MANRARQSFQQLLPSRYFQRPIKTYAPCFVSQVYNSPKLYNRSKRCLVFPCMQLENQKTVNTSFRWMSDGRPRGALWRSRKVISKEALFVIQELKRGQNDPNPSRLSDFTKIHVSRLLKVDLLAVLAEFQRQQEVSLSLLIFNVIKGESWYKPDMYFYKDMIVMLAKAKKMEEAMNIWKEMKEQGIEPDIKTYTEVIRGYLQTGSPTDAMNVYEEMKKSPAPPEETPYRVLLKGLFPHPLLRNRVKKDFMEIFPDRHVYDPPEEIFGEQQAYDLPEEIFGKQEALPGSCRA
eukprot:TRINITY_DN27416_c0_g1_i1.p1 TRINITY_DN27416_c0_g1~~TRINITY_DN27416_c0_g1_i1.p1  ORF type:complete len:292 (+),score=22.24 TRINITY_DN27416_c0_g1_i1:124-999(+)